MKVELTGFADGLAVGSEERKLSRKKDSPGKMAFSLAGSGESGGKRFGEFKQVLVCGCLVE